jgi:hypothetical protein
MKVHGKTLMTAAAGTMALFLAAAPAAAQICSGFPTARGQTSVGLRASFPTEGTTIGVEASRNWLNPLGVFANLNLLMPDADDADNIAIGGLGFAYEVGDFIPAVPQWLSVCPTAAVTIQGGDATTFTFPVGLGFGTSIGTPEGFSILPFVMPQFVTTRVSLDGINTTDHNFGIGAGVFARFGGVYGGVTFGRIMASEEDATIAFQGGLVFPPIR